MEPAEVARRLAVAEDRLRAEGMTGARAFEALATAIRGRLGDRVDVHPVARDAVDGVPTEAVDLLGLAYERFFADLFKGKRGQYFTPGALVEWLVDGVGPGDRVLDPTCGSGGFLVCAARRGAEVRGIERDPLLVELARLNLRLAGIAGEVRQDDFFAADPEPVDVVVANPPFSVVIDDPAVLERYELGRGRDRALSDALFVEALARWVRPGGRAAIVLPWSILVNSSAAAVRERLDDAFVREGVVGLPEGVFRPFGGAAGRACLLWLRRRPAPSTACRWAEVADPGWDVRLQRYKATSTAEIDRLRHGEGWVLLPEGAWTPGAMQGAGSRMAVAKLASMVPVRTPRGGPFVAVDLADVDKTTGEVTAGRVETDLPGPKASFEPGDVLVSRLRPELGNVAIARDATRSGLPLVGSSEWLALRPEKLRYFLLHSLRTPAWRARLPVTGGQTRPRTTADAVLGSEVAWPGERLASRVDGLGQQLHAERAGLRDRLLALQRAIDRFAAGEIDEDGLGAEIDAIESL